MADELENRMVAALDRIKNVAETGGYLKKETCQDMDKAVSVIRNCFVEMKTLLEEERARSIAKESASSEVKPPPSGL